MTRKRLLHIVWTVLKFAIVLAVLGSGIRYRMTRPLPAIAHTIARGDVVREAFGRGTVESRREVQLGFDMVGRLSDVFVDEGDRVKLGQVVAQLAPEQLAAEAQSASSGVGLAQAAIGRIAADRQRAEADQTFARVEEERFRALVAGGSATKRDLDLAVQRLALAQAEVARVRATQSEASRQVAVATGTADARRSILTRAALVSPFDGVVIRRLRDPGDTVSVGTTVLRIVATDQLWSRAWIDENALPWLRDGQTVRVRLGAEGDTFLTGTVDRIGREVDRQTHELRVDVLLQNPPERIAVGQRADVWIELERKAQVAGLPLAFLHRDARGTFCFADQKGRIARVVVSVGVVGPDLVEVINGLAPGDVVLTNTPGSADLAEGRSWSQATP